MAEIYGYTRVSTKEQNEERQLIALDKFGVCREKIYIDKKSGKNFDRLSYKQLMKK